MLSIIDEAQVNLEDLRAKTKININNSAQYNKDSFDKDKA